MSESPIVRFYRGTGTDHAGRTLDEILTWGDEALENVHDYIQWLFPTSEPSRANTFAPLVTLPDREIFRADPALRAALLRAFDRILAFYGFARVPSAQGVELAPSDAWSTRSPNWLNPSNHNHLRLTRIMKCLNGLGLEQDALALQRALLSLGEQRGGKFVTAATMRHWRTAVDG